MALSASSVEGIFENIRQMGNRLDLGEKAVTVVEQERRRLAAVRERTAALRRASVVVLEWTDPLFAMGNWGPELVELAHGDLRIGKQGEYSTSIQISQLLKADPEFLIVAPCGFGLERAIREKSTLERLPDWRKLRAVRDGTVAFADGNLFFNRSGMTISRTAEITAEILHGITFGTPSHDMCWRWIGEAA
jgi:iron complex transport system substrate-binding protein